MSIVRQLPQSIEAEETLLGMIIQDNKVLEESKKYITTPDMFYSNVNKRTYEIMLNLEKKSSSINPVTILAALTDNDKKMYEGLNGYFLTGLVDLSDMSYKVNDYSRIIAEKFLKRRLIKSTQLIEKTAYKNDKALMTL